MALWIVSMPCGKLLIRFHMQHLPHFILALFVSRCPWYDNMRSLRVSRSEWLVVADEVCDALYIFCLFWSFTLHSADFGWTGWICSTPFASLQLILTMTVTAAIQSTIEHFLAVELSRVGKIPLSWIKVRYEQTSSSSSASALTFSSSTSSRSALSFFSPSSFSSHLLIFLLTPLFFCDNHGSIDYPSDTAASPRAIAQNIATQLADPVAHNDTQTPLLNLVSSITVVKPDTSSIDSSHHNNDDSPIGYSSLSVDCWSVIYTVFLYQAQSLDWEDTSPCRPPSHFKPNELQLTSINPLSIYAVPPLQSPNFASVVVSPSLRVTVLVSPVATVSDGPPFLAVPGLNVSPPPLSACSAPTVPLVGAEQVVSSSPRPPLPPLQ